MRHKRRTQPNDRTQRTAAKLIGIAKDITDLAEHYRNELSALGYPRRSNGPKVSGGGGGMGSSTSERDAVSIAALTSSREDLRDMITDLEQRTDALIRHVKHQLGRPLHAADGLALCCDQQRGRDGANEWGDATCTELPAQAGLCARDWQAERRWRVAHNMPARINTGV